MSLLTRIRTIVESAATGEGVSAPPSWNIPVPFDANLVTRLIAGHDALDARLAALHAVFSGPPAVAESATRECATALHELRHLEALRLYPIIARGIASDPIARRLFWQSRMLMLGLARRVMRHFDALTHAIQLGKGIDVAASQVRKGLTEYRARNESSIYPLYTTAGSRVTHTRKQA